MRDRDVFNAIQAALAASGAFDPEGVFLWGFADSAEQGAEHARSVAILPSDWSEDDRYDDTSGNMFITGHVKLVVKARDENPQARDEAAGKLDDACRNALNGAALNATLAALGGIYPQFTKCQRGTWKDPVPPERTIEITFQYVYDAPTWTGFDTSE